MSGAASFGDLAVVAAGIAVIIGVVALLTSAEVAKRLQALVDQKLAEADVKLAASLNKQDQRITTLRQVMSDTAEDQETAIRSMAQDLKEMKECIALMRDYLDKVEAQQNGNNGRSRRNGNAA